MKEKRSMKTESKQVIKLANSIKNRGIWMLTVEVILTVLVAIIFPVIFAVIYIDPYVAVPPVFSWLWIGFFLIYFLLIMIFALITIIQISNTDWHDEILNKEKTLYWILSLVFAFTIGFIAPILWIIWGNKAKNIYHKLNEESKKQDDSKINNI